MAFAACRIPLSGGRPLEAAFAKLNLKGNTVRAIAIDGTSGTILPIAADGSPLGLASMYNDVAEQPDIALVAASAPHETAALGATSPLARALPHSRVRHPHPASGGLAGRKIFRPLRRDGRKQRAEIGLRSGGPSMAGLDRQDRL
ncbi:hypothetical protein [Aestuariivirga sp.]|uniref:hypothetical protein n=1 Tax=Aestuariivirga sp. TaxID=2650926 RepID=UPI0039E52D02